MPRRKKSKPGLARNSPNEYRPSKKRALPHTSTNLISPADTTQATVSPSSANTTSTVIISGPATSALPFPLRRSERLEALTVTARENQIHTAQLEKDKQIEDARRSSEKAKKAGVKILKFTEMAGELSRKRTPIRELHFNTRLEYIDSGAKWRVLMRELDWLSRVRKAKKFGVGELETVKSGFWGGGIERGHNVLAAKMETPRPVSHSTPATQQKSSAASVSNDEVEGIGKKETRTHTGDAIYGELPLIEIERTGGDQPRMLLKIKVKNRELSVE
ncbi:hypothetical protein K458DRAFT_405980 [Lentithecium fluviatile CBS 122367]|uniref:Uncharacterized protein n=1 Tax=Lentithecium fluviatile CBS 122367 TaxID=1168545 RepID=A0A6G1IVV0_9PLEO|nr:hypothetical protein K458DRAFT_405980 [Lentithecium fluviatile CBS 122367]